MVKTLLVNKKYNNKTLKFTQMMMGKNVVEVNRSSFL